MRLFWGIVLLILAGCAVTQLPEDPNKTILDNTITTNEGVYHMAFMIEEKNQLVDFGQNPDAPKAPDVGIAITFAQVAPNTVARFSASGPVVLHGAYQADGAVLRHCEDNPGAAIYVTVIRVDKPFGRTDRLVTPVTESSKPPALRPYPESYREGGQFRVDIKAFFELPSEPGQYTVEAALSGYFSGHLTFELVE